MRASAEYYLPVRQSLKSFYPLMKWRIPATDPVTQRPSWCNQYRYKRHARNNRPSCPSASSLQGVVCSHSHVQEGPINPTPDPRRSALWPLPKSSLSDSLKGLAGASKSGDCHKTPMATRSRNADILAGQIQYVRAMYLIWQWPTNGMPVAWSVSSNDRLNSI